MERPSAPGGDAGAARLLANDLGRPLPAQRMPGFLAYVGGRTRFFDEQVREALGQRRCQIVIIGAGYDDRALRFRTQGVRFVEVDHPATQADKRERLDRLGVDTSDVRFVAADFEADALDERLLPELDAEIATLVLCESVLMYLRPQAGQKLLRSLSRAPGASVRMVSDLPVRPASWRGRLTFAQFRLFAWAAREPVRTVLAPDAVEDYLDGCGWREQRRVTGAELAIPRGRAEWVFVVAVPQRLPRV